MACELVLGYFMQRGKGTAFTEHLCINFMCNCFLRYFWFGLVSLFNGISTFVGYLMPMLFS